jgi:WD40 repeat protein
VLSCLSVLGYHERSDCSACFIHLIYFSCVLSVACIHIGGKSLLASAATDGVIMLWHVEDGCIIPTPMLSLPVHQSGVTCLDIRTVDQSSFRIVSCGDDGALVVVDVSFHHDTPGLISKWMVPNAHSTSVTACCFGNGTDTIISSGADSRVTCWVLHASVRITCHSPQNCSSSFQNWELAWSRMTGVADVSALALDGFACVFLLSA